jgi:uncharacterized protein YsxB (DUF464 family)
VIEIVFVVREDDLGFEAKGHALFDNKGKDLVCCAVSTLIQNWRLSSQALSGQTPEYNQDAGKARGKIKRTRDTELLFDSLRLGLEALERQYPDHIKTSLEERNVS